ncbi:hypothetical protein VE00_10477 [Pseudogymnoascus sp. WSF 3629]|nr:hypothetical protein VE00_10477 [Pseudogymnoascus sp. WSF 3629]
MGQDLEDEGRRLQKRTQPYRASLKQTSDFEPNKESEEDTSLEQTSDFEPNEESEEDMSASESVNKHQAVGARQESRQNADPLSAMPVESPSIVVETPRRRSSRWSNIKPVSDGSLRIEQSMPQQDMPRESLLPPVRAPARFPSAPRITAGASGASRTGLVRRPREHLDSHQQLEERLHSIKELVMNIVTASEGVYKLVDALRNEVGEGDEENEDKMEEEYEDEDDEDEDEDEDEGYE